MPSRPPSPPSSQTARSSSTPSAQDSPRPGQERNRWARALLPKARPRSSGRRPCQTTGPPAGSSATVTRSRGDPTARSWFEAQAAPLACVDECRAFQAQQPQGHRPFGREPAVPSISPGDLLLGDRRHAFSRRPSDARQARLIGRRPARGRRRSCDVRAAVVAPEDLGGAHGDPRASPTTCGWWAGDRRGGGDQAQDVRQSSKQRATAGLMQSCAGRA